MFSFAESTFDAIFLNEQFNFSEVYLVWKIFASPNMSSEPKSDDIIFWHVRIWAADRFRDRRGFQTADAAKIERFAAKLNYSPFQL